jgi:hypothetical protein
MRSNTPIPQRRDALYGPVVLGRFQDMPRARLVLEELRAAGFTLEQVSMVARLQGVQQQGVQQEFSDPRGSIPGWLSEIRTISIPDAGQAVVAGPLARGAAGAGGLPGALVASGVREEDAKDYGQELSSGAVLVVVQSYSDDQARGAYMLFERHSAASLRAYSLATGEPLSEMPVGPDR